MQALHAAPRPTRDIGRKLLQSMGLAEPTDEQIEAAVAANNRFVETWEAIVYDAASPPNGEGLPRSQTCIGQLTIRRGNEDDYDMLAGGDVVGRIFNANASPVGASWMWTLAFGHHEDRTRTHGYVATREAAMAAFAKSWRRE